MDKEIKPPFLRTPFNYDRNKASDETGLKCLDPSLTQQQFKDEADINTIVERFHLTGEAPQLQQLPSHGDFTGIFDFQSAMNQVIAARETFMSLPAKLRTRFHNDPQEFIDFCSDQENEPEARRMGLLAPKPPQDDVQRRQNDPAPPQDAETPPKPLDPPRKPQDKPKDPS